MTAADPGTLTDAITELIAELRSTRDPPVLLDAEASAKLLSIGTSTFFRAVAAGELPRAVHPPGGPRWKRSDLLKAVERMKPGRRRRAAK